MITANSPLYAAAGVRTLVAYKEANALSEKWDNGGWTVNQGGGKLINDATATGVTVTDPASGITYVEAQVRGADQHQSGFLGIGGSWVSGSTETWWFKASDVTTSPTKSTDEVQKDIVDKATQDLLNDPTNPTLTGSGKGGLFGSIKWYYIAIPLGLILIGGIVYLISSRNN